MGPNSEVVLRTRDLSMHFPFEAGLFRKSAGVVRAVDGVSLDIHAGETVGLVGESGSGKTTFGRTVTRLLDPTAGTVEFRSDAGLVDITRMPQKDLRQIRRQMNMVFQDPLSSLNPRMRVKTIIGEPLILHHLAKGRQLQDRVAELLELVGLRPHHMDRFPHAFSGGQRQRIAIARALALNPRFIVCDEAVSALDASVQAQVLNLFMDLQERFGLTYLFIAHDLAVVRHVSDQIVVLYLGRIVEQGPAKSVTANPQHPYTEALLSAMPEATFDRGRRRMILEGDLPDAANPPPGCRFSSRCNYCAPICLEEEPELKATRHGPNHLAACHFADELQLVSS